jgi:hypothetical protein
MHKFKKWLEAHPGLIRLVLLLFVALNLYSAHRISSVSTLMAFSHLTMAAALLLSAILIH